MVHTHEIKLLRSNRVFPYIIIPYVANREPPLKCNEIASSSISTLFRNMDLQRHKEDNHKQLDYSKMQTLSSKKFRTVETPRT